MRSISARMKSISGMFQPPSIESRTKQLPIIQEEKKTGTKCKLLGLEGGCRGTPTKSALLPAPFLVRTIREETGPLRPAIAGATRSDFAGGEVCSRSKLTLLGHARSAGANFLRTSQTN